MNIDDVQKPLAFILPKRDMVFSLDDQELVSELTARTPQLPEEPSLAPPATAFPERGPAAEPSELPQEPAEVQRQQTAQPRVDS